MTTLVLARHGQTVWHQENRYAGVSDVDLTDAGVRQAAALADWSRLHRPDAVYVSPIRRARETAAPTLAALGIEGTVVEDLREVDFGVGEGRTMAELAVEMPSVVAEYRRNPAINPLPGAESVVTAAERGSAALRAIAADHHVGTVLVVAHNTLLRLALCQLLDIPVARYRGIFPRLENGALSTICIPDDGLVSLLSLNVPL